MDPSPQLLSPWTRRSYVYDVEEKKEEEEEEEEEENRGEWTLLIHDSKCASLVRRGRDDER